MRGLETLSLDNFPSGNVPEFEHAGIITVLERCQPWHSDGDRAWALATVQVARPWEDVREPRLDIIPGRGPHAHAAGASMIQTRNRPPRPCGGGLGGAKTKQAPAPTGRGPPRPCGGGLGRPKAKEASMSLWRGPQ